MEKPAILGGKPVSKEKIPFAKVIIREEEKKAVEEILREGSLAGGEYIKKFEKAFAEFIGAKHAISISNGTDALFLSYLALGISFGAKVLTTPITFVATASTIIHAGAIPFFADVLNDANLDPKSVQEMFRKQKFDAITVVHMYGKPVEMDEIKEIARENNAFIIEDAAHAHGAEYKGTKVGLLGDIAAFSLYPTKIIAAGGWGGVIVTNSDEIAEKLILLRAHGELRHKIGPEGAYEYEILGYNMRMSHIEAAIAYYQLRRINEFISCRRKLAKMLSDLLRDIPGIVIPEEPPYVKHVYYIYSILIDEKTIGWTRDEFVKALNAEGIEARKGYHKPLHQQPLFKMINDPTINHFAKINKYPNYAEFKLPNAERIAKSTVWLPMHPYLTEEQIELIAKAIHKLVQWRRK
ncbi:MAG: DegT/DnrJ/EryC1/StrS family aminotransferase [Candidatus Njordarchaeales archaeon]